jgi:hypothetical protein
VLLCFQRQESIIGSVKTRIKLYGESVREIGVLMIVFVPLDAVFDGLRRLSTTNIILYAVVGFMLVLIGTEMERNGHDAS